MSWAALGWCATGVYLGAHAYLSVVQQYRRDVYLLLNVLGGVLLMVASVGMSSPHAVVINGYWAVVSLLALGGLFARMRITVPRGWMLAALYALIAITSLVVIAQAGKPHAVVATVGWAGTVTYCAIYWLIATRQIARSSYLWLSIAAGLCVLPAYADDANWPSFAMNLCWIGISAYGLARRRALPEESLTEAGQTGNAR